MWRGCTTNSAAPLFGRFYSRVAWIIFVFVNTLVLHTGHSINDENSSAAADNYEANDYRNLLTSETIKQNMFSEAGLKNMSTAANKQQILAEYMQTSRSKRAVVGADAKIWNVYQHGDKFVVPYTIVSNYTDNQIKKIEKAMEEIESKTCILFQHINDKDTVEFYKGRSYAEISNSPNDGCHSVIGRSETINAVKLEVRAAEQKTCIVHHIVLHELLHLLGLYHEHQRPDRDKFMTIAREHVEDGRFYNFDKKMDARTLSDLIETNGTDIDDHPNKHKLKGVDEQSIMMYKADTFSKKDGLAVIKMHAKKWQNRIGKSKQASELDYLKINLLYNCPGVNKMLAGYNGKADINKSANNSKELHNKNKNINKSDNKSKDSSTEKHAEQNKDSVDEDSDENKSKVKKKKHRRKHHSSRRSRKHSSNRRKKSRKTNRKSHSHRSKTKRRSSTRHKRVHTRSNKKTVSKKSDKHKSKKSRGRNHVRQDTELHTKTHDLQKGTVEDSALADKTHPTVVQTHTVRKPQNWITRLNKNLGRRSQNSRIITRRRKPAQKATVKKELEKQKVTEIDKKSEEKLKLDNVVAEEHQNENSKDKTVEIKHEAEKHEVHEQKEEKVEDTKDGSAKKHSSEQKVEQQQENVSKPGESQEKEEKTKGKSKSFGGLRLRKKSLRLGKKLQSKMKGKKVIQEGHKHSDTQMEKIETSKTSTSIEKTE